jgi:hypothetical protein
MREDTSSGDIECANFSFLQKVKGEHDESGRDSGLSTIREKSLGAWLTLPALALTPSYTRTLIVWIS